VTKKTTTLGFWEFLGILLFLIKGWGVKVKLFVEFGKKTGSLKSVLVKER
jgi:hypothetical protein